MLGFALGPQGFLDTNMLVYSMRNGHVGGHVQHETSTVEYRLNLLYF